MGSSATCPQCGGANLRRSRRRGLLERGFSLLGYLPYRCRDCQTRFFRQEAGKSRLLPGLAGVVLGLVLLVAALWWLAAPDPAPRPVAQDQAEIARLRQEVDNLRLQQQQLMESMGKGATTPPLPAPGINTPPAVPPAGARSPLPGPPPKPTLSLPPLDETPAPSEPQKLVDFLNERMVGLEIRIGQELGRAAILWRDLMRQGRLPLVGGDQAMAQYLRSPFAPNHGLGSQRPRAGGAGGAGLDSERSQQTLVKQIQARMALLQKQLEEQKAKNAMMQSMFY